MRPAALVVEIVSALVALGCAVALVAHLVRWARARRAGRSAGGAWHVPAALVLCGAAVVHGTAATLYASGAPAAAYALGWAAVASFAASGAVMVPAARRALRNPVAAHVALFCLGIALVVVHAVAARL